MLGLIRINKPEIKEEGKIERPNRPKNIIRMPKGEEYKIKTNIIWNYESNLLMKLEFHYYF